VEKHDLKQKPKCGTADNTGEARIHQCEAGAIIYISFSYFFRLEICSSRFILSVYASEFCSIL